MVIRCVVGVGSVYCVIEAMVVTRGGSLSPSPKGSPSANRQGKGKKKAITFKSK